MELLTVSVWAPWMWFILIGPVVVVLAAILGKAGSTGKEVLIVIMSMLTAFAFLPGILANYDGSKTRQIEAFEETFNVRVENLEGDNSLPLYPGKAELVELFVDNEVNLCEVITFDGVYNVECDGKELKPNDR